MVLCYHANMAKKTFIQEFAEKHFTGSYAKQLRAVKTGEFLFKFFNPGSPVPTDPAELSTLTCAAMVKNEQLLPDDVFVRILLLHSRDKDGSSLLTFDMVADLLESDVYKKFGTKAGSNDANLKKDFEHWLISKSTMARVYGDDSSIQNVDVVLNQDGIHRILNALEVSGYKDDLGCTPDFDGYRYKINQRVDNFNSVFVNGVGVDELDKLVANNQNDNQKFYECKPTSVVIPNKPAVILNRGITTGRAPQCFNAGSQDLPLSFCYPKRSRC